MSIWLALAAGVVCAGAGHGSARYLSAREERLAAWETGLSCLEGMLRRGGGELPGMLRRAGEKLPALLMLADRLEQCPAAPPERLTEGLPRDPLLEEKEMEALLSCLPALFSPDGESQLSAVSRSWEEAARLRTAAREGKEKNSRLYLRLGYLAGAAAFIMLC